MVGLRVMETSSDLATDASALNAVLLRLEMLPLAAVFSSSARRVLPVGGLDPASTLYSGCIGPRADAYDVNATLSARLIRHAAP
jgi:hypothetical protein